MELHSPNTHIAAAALAVIALPALGWMCWTRRRGLGAGLAVALAIAGTVALAFKLPWVAPVVAFAGAGLFLAFLATPAVLRVSSLANAHPRPWAMFFFIGGPALALGCVYHLEHTLNRDLYDPALELDDGMDMVLHPLRRAAFTDNDLRITLFRRLPDERTGERNTRIEDQILQARASQVIRVAPADVAVNCHGWIFANQEYCVLDTDVEDILRDNDYRVVEKARPGDVIIYRDKSGGIVHSGIVRSAGDMMLVESKWGALGAFVHRPADQPYGGAWSFYRSRRAGHALRIEADSTKRIVAE